MSQIALPLDSNRPSAARHAVAHPSPARGRVAEGAPAFDGTGHRIGLDYARHGLTPPADHLHPGHPVREGWMRGRSAFAGRVLPTRPEVRRWLALRLDAWLRGRLFDELTVTPMLLARIDVSRCPVTRQALGCGESAPDDAVVIAVSEADGFTAGNLVMLSRRADRARGWTAADGPDPLLPAERLRLETLLGFATPLSHTQASALPLALLPPLRLRLRNPAQALQVLLAQVFVGPGWARRMAEIGTLMPESARRAFALYMSAMLARSLDIAADAGADERRLALEDAGTHPSVCARWQALAGQVDQAAALRIVRTAAECGLWPRPCRWVDESALTA